jgi:uncharacterized protein (TIGR02217 family)
VSNAVFPGTLASMPGLAWSVTKVPTFNTKSQLSVGNAELRASFTPYPLWKWTLVYSVLIQGAPFAHYETLLGFYLERLGSFDSFLYDDPSDDAVVDQPFGVGDGATTTFQLVRTLGGFTEPVYNVNAITAVKVAGTPTSAYTQAGGLINFSSAPAAAAALTWTGSYYWRVHFSDDTNTFEQFAYQYWTLKAISLTSIIGS